MTVSFIGTQSTLSSDFFPPLYLNKSYELALLHFDTYNSIPNIDDANNTFYFIDITESKEKEYSVTLPTGTYEITDIEDQLNKLLYRDAIDRKKISEENQKEKKKKFITLEANLQTMKAEVECEYKINFYREKRNIGSVLGFSNKYLSANKRHESDRVINIRKTNIINIACNITKGAYINGIEKHIIHQLPITHLPGHKLTDEVLNPIYFPITVKDIHNITLLLIDEKEKLINFRGESIHVRLHLRPCH